MAMQGMMPPDGGAPVDANLEITLSDIVNNDANKQQYKEQIIDNLKKCYDPEISIDIYSLGLIYDFKVTDDNTAWVLMSLTSAFCPAVDQIVADVKSQVESVEGINSCNVRITMVPQWGKDMIDKEVVELMGW
jgi:metal-sulfur cluster biosynthetic enzyme